MQKGPAHNTVNVEEFTARMVQYLPPNLDIVNVDNLSDAIMTGCNVINKVAKSCVSERNIRMEEGDAIQPRWKRLLEANDPKSIWKAIDWKGGMNNSNVDRPNDEQFKVHFENLLNPECREEESVELESAPMIPVLDDPFTPQELDDAIKSMNKNKSFSGICPGLLPRLPIPWFLFLLSVFNAVFQYMYYPMLWCYSKLIILFKSGDRMACGNYRGINIMDTLAKLYDLLILNRLRLWCNVDKCQAGAMQKRGCLEKIMTLRMLVDYAGHTKSKLYIVFMDYSKAYDRVPRNKLLLYLKSLGCGKVMLTAIRNMYSCTRNVLKSATVDASVGVRQGAPSSCLLFTIYMDKMVRMLKQSVQADGFLGAMHVLLLMDDAVIMATSREMCMRKVNIVLEYCSEYGMKLNDKKTKFFVINHTGNDKDPLVTQGNVITYCERYMYLGAWFTDRTNMNEVMKLHEAGSESVVNKFAVFCAANTDMPYYYKKKVFDAAVTSALLYSTETWLTNNYKYVARQYSKLVKSLLAVRKNTSNDLCLIESGIYPVDYVISNNRKRFLVSKLNRRDIEEPFHFVYNLCMEANTPGYIFIARALQFNNAINPLDKIIESTVNKPITATKYTTYKTELNPNLSVHEVYSGRVYIPDYMRQSFTRVRLMSHELKIETGRWSRTPREQRLCQCGTGVVQTENHVLLECELSHNLRDRFRHLNVTHLNLLFGEGEHIGDLCKYIHEVLKVYKTT